MKKILSRHCATTNSTTLFRSSSSSSLSSVEALTLLKKRVVFSVSAECNILQQTSYSTINNITTSSNNTSEKYTDKPWLNGPGLEHFMSHISSQTDNLSESLSSSESTTTTTLSRIAEKKGVFIETYGCQMNVSDTQIILSILDKNGYKLVDNEKDASVILLNTCAVRENAENKIWIRLNELKKKRHENKQLHNFNPEQYPTSGVQIGVLGCMAERLKTKLIDTNMVDVVVGPDQYRDLPNLLKKNEESEMLQRSLDDNVEGRQAQLNVILSMDETYADIEPVRVGDTGKSSFVSIMRGCDNMCSYCIVPFTRGRERSRDITSILNEIRQLSKNGIREVTLLGQNVNSYRDTTESEYQEKYKANGKEIETTDGFKTIYKTKVGGITFTELLYEVSQIDKEMRIRYTSPHPKDYPDSLIELIRETPNICNQIHLPAQSGSTRMLEKMRRGYTAESYIALVDRIKNRIPNIGLSSDFIAGFCSETEQDHQDTLNLLKHVNYDQAYLFAYSLREKTHAHRNYQDDVPADVKNRRLNELVQTYRENLAIQYEKEVGTIQCVLIDSDSKRDPENYWVGRTDNNKRVVIPKSKGNFNVGDYVAVSIQSWSGQTLFCNLDLPIEKVTLQDFYKNVTY